MIVQKVVLGSGESSPAGGTGSHRRNLLGHSLGFTTIRENRGKNIDTNTLENVVFNKTSKENTNPKKSLGTVCGFTEKSRTIVNFMINIKTIAGQESTVKNDLDKKMAKCKVLSGYQVTPGTFSTGNKLSCMKTAP